MVQERRKLGRGIRSLMNASPVPNRGDSETAGPTSRPVPTGTDGLAADQARTPNDVFLEIDVHAVVPNTYQPRISFPDDDIRALAESIRESGLVQPIIVRPATGGIDERYELISGERRWRAARMLELDRIPAIVRRLDDRDAAMWALAENIQRADLNPIEQARAFRRLHAEFDLAHGEIASRLGLSRVAVTNTLRLLDLDEWTLAQVERGKLSAGHGRALLTIDEVDARQSLARQAAEDGWSVRRLEREVNDRRQPATPVTAASSPAAASTPASTSASIRELEQRLSAYLGTDVHINTGTGRDRGKLIISFYDLDQFDGLLSRIGFATSELARTL